MTDEKAATEQSALSLLIDILIDSNLISARKLVGYLGDQLTGKLNGVPTVNAVNAMMETNAHRAIVHLLEGLAKTNAINHDDAVEVIARIPISVLQKKD